MDETTRDDSENGANDGRSNVLRLEHPAMRPVGRIDPPSPVLIQRLLPLVRRLYAHYFRCEVRHIGRLPQAPVLVVSNHNALGFVEIPLFGYAWYTTFGIGRPVYGLAHELIFRVRPLGRMLRGLGAVPASRHTARQLLASGRDVLVFPGGDWEASRPITQAGLIDFGGRKGFVRLALEENVTIAPLVVCGAHETIVILLRGTALARGLRLFLKRLKTLPVTPQGLLAVYKVALAAQGRAHIWAAPFWLINAWLNLPWLPNKVTMEFLEPVDLRRELGHIDDAQARLDAGYDLITSRMQRSLDRLRAERRALLRERGRKVGRAVARATTNGLAKTRRRVSLAGEAMLRP